MRKPRHLEPERKLYMLEYARMWRAKNREKVRAYFRKYRVDNKERLALQDVRYIESRRRAKRKYKIVHREKVLASERKRVKHRFRNDIQYRLRILAGCASNRMVRAGWTKRHRSAELIGCSWSELKAHIESRFQPGMTWENHSKFGWHIDHIRPLMSFDLTQPDQMAVAMHYSNLQPLWWRDNITKGDKWDASETDLPKGGEKS